jgi:ADP-heptose:LPS heptosyltransferase
MKKALIIRPGAYGDCIIITPLFRLLKERGYHVIYHCGKRGLDVTKHNPYIDEYIEYTKEGQKNDNCDQEWKELENKISPAWCRNFAESIEVNISVHPKSAAYNYPKNEQLPRVKQNFYDATMIWAGLEERGLRPELFFDKQEERDIQKYLRPKSFNIVWGLAGSGHHKAYPWVDYVIGELIKNYPNIHIITVGDERCQILEYNKPHPLITSLSGKTSWRESMLLTKFADLVVSPDTGILHASGAFSTPKIGILGHTTKQNITKYFKNDYSLEAIEEECECAPCNKLIYDNKLQCPIDNLNGASWCMSKGHPPLRLYHQILKVMHDHKANHSRKQELSNLR